MKPLLASLCLALVSCVHVASKGNTELRAENDDLKAKLAKAQAIPPNAQTLHIIYDSNVPNPPPLSDFQNVLKTAPVVGNTLSGLAQDAQSIQPTVTVKK